MVIGQFHGNIPLVSVAVASEESVVTPIVILDTGFTGDLQIPPKLADELRLKVIGATRAQIAGGQILEVPIALAQAAMEGEVRNIEVLISQGLPLAGIGLFSKFSYKAVVDCKYKTVVLEKAA